MSISRLDFTNCTDTSAFFIKYESLIMSKTEKDGNCYIFQGSVKNKYVRQTCSFVVEEDGVKHTIHREATAHKLMYMCSRKVAVIPAPYQISHLCGRPLCVNSEHLVSELPKVNTYIVAYKYMRKNLSTQICSIVAYKSNVHLILLWPYLMYQIPFSCISVLIYTHRKYLFLQVNKSRQVCHRMKICTDHNPKCIISAS